MGISVATATAIAKVVPPPAQAAANAGPAASANEDAATASGPKGDFMSALIAQLRGNSAQAIEVPAGTLKAAKADSGDDESATDPAAFMAGLQAAASLVPQTPNTPPPVEGKGKSDAGLTVVTGTPSDGQAAPTEGNFVLNLGMDGGKAAKNAAFSAALQDADTKLSSQDGTTAPLVAPHTAQQTHQQAPANTTAVQTPVRDARWGEDFSQKVVWMVKQDQQSAQLTLNPPQLGPVEVSIHMGPDSKATATFISPHAEVREAIEAALPRLRDMMTAAGVSLGQTNVGSESSMAQQQMAQQQQQQQQNARNFGGAGSGRFGGGGDGGEGAAILGAEGISGRSGAIQQGVGLVDTFA